jgi:hypothetical protein
LANLSESEDEEDSQQASDEVSDALALMPQGAESTLAQYTASGITAWAARAKAYATVVILSTGEAPALQCIRCHREERRHLLLVRLARKGGCKTLAKVAQLAAKLANDGCFPGPMQHRRRSEFLHRCVEAVKTVAPTAECNPKALPDMDAFMLRRALNNQDAPYEGCFTPECLDLEIAWTQDACGWARCAHCDALKASGRTFHCMLDLARRTRSVMHDYTYEPVKWVRNPYEPAKWRRTS